MIITLITVVHIIVCFFLIIVVLLQSGKSGDIAAAFGGMGSQTAFGPRGAATALSRATTWSAIMFMVTSITLSIAGLAACWFDFRAARRYRRTDQFATGEAEIVVSPRSSVLGKTLMADDRQLMTDD